MPLAPILAAALAAGKLALPAPAPVVMDYLAAEGSQVWVPAMNLGKVFVLDGPAGSFRAVEGFPTSRAAFDRVLGPSSVSLSSSTAFVGNRGDSTVCAFDRRSLRKQSCAALPGVPDGTFWVSPTREVWATTPRDKSLQIVDARGPLALAGRIALDGAPEGYAVDELKALVYTNLEDKDRTLVIDARARTVVASFEPGCGEDGPRGIALDSARGLLFVACTDAVVSLDPKTGARRARLETGKGVDNIDYLPRTRRLYISAGKAGRLTVAEAGDDGSLRETGTAQVGQGSRVVVVTRDGTAYAADSQAGALWVVKPDPMTLPAPAHLDRR